MRWLVRNLFRLALLLAVAFAAYAIFAELPPPTRERVVTLSPGEGGQ